MEFCPKCGKNVETKIKKCSGEAFNKEGNKVKIRINEYYCIECNYCMKARKVSEELV